MASVKLQYDDLMNPVIRALKNLGGSGTIEEINNKVAEIEKIPSEQLEFLHNPEKGGMTEIEYRLMWTRTYLKQYGVIDNSSRGVWSLTEKGSSIEKVDEKDVVRFVREKLKKNKQESSDDSDEPNSKVEWQEELLDVILKMSPSGFERLVQRRDFRGAMVGRADKGLLITTGAFTKDATKEATRDGAPAIDLVDGDQLVEKLKQLSLGVSTKKIEVEQVSIDPKWFSSL